MMDDQEFVRRLKSIQSLAHNILVELGGGEEVNKDEISFWNDIINGLGNVIKLYTDYCIDKYIVKILFGRDKNERC